MKLIFESDKNSQFLSGLTGDDRKLLESVARTTAYPKDHLIMEAGDTVKGLWVVVKGRVRAVRSYMGSQITVATLGEGLVFGEMGFIEDLPASASVYGDADDNQVAFLSAADLNNLLVSVPGLAVRFYRALAAVISQKLRETSARIPALMVEEVAQVVQNPNTHTGRADLRSLPPSFVEGIDAFKGALAQAERMLNKERKTAEEVQPLVSAACTALRESLQEHVKRNEKLSDAIGAFAFRETFPFFMASQFIDIVYTKPRGYAGDFETINMIYENRPTGDGRIGPLVDRWILGEPHCSATRQRRGTVSAHIARLLAASPPEANLLVTSLAVGPGREFFDALELDRRGQVHITGVDIDPDSLNFVAERASAVGVLPRIRLVQGNIIRMATGKAPIELPPQHLVYSIGLMDYLQEPVVVKCLDWMFDILEPGGEAIIGNFDSRNPTKAFMDYIGEWVLIHRTPEDLRRIFAQSKFGERLVEVTADTTDIQLFARCVK